MSKDVELYARTQLEIISKDLGSPWRMKGNTEIILRSFRVVIALLLEILANQKRHLISIGLKTSNGS